MTSSYSKTSVFVRPQKKKSDKLAFLKNSTLRTLFLNMCFWYPRTPFTCGRKVETYEKIWAYAWTGPQHQGLYDPTTRRQRERRLKSEFAFPLS